MEFFRCIREEVLDCYMDKLKELLRIENNIFELKEICITEYLVYYQAPYTG